MSCDSVRGGSAPLLEESKLESWGKMLVGVRAVRDSGARDEMQVMIFFVSLFTPVSRCVIHNAGGVAGSPPPLASGFEQDWGKLAGRPVVYKDKATPLLFSSQNKSIHRAKDSSTNYTSTDIYIYNVRQVASYKCSRSSCLGRSTRRSSWPRLLDYSSHHGAACCARRNGCCRGSGCPDHLTRSSQRHLHRYVRARCCRHQRFHKLVSFCTTKSLRMKCTAY